VYIIFTDFTLFLKLGVINVIARVLQYYYCMVHEDFDVDKYLLDNPRDFFNKFVVKMTRIKK